jgi:endonuclease YncB( thermonuclease family)
MYRLHGLTNGALFSVVLLLSLAVASIGSAKAIFGRVTELTSANTMKLDHGAGQYDIRIADIEVPTNEPFASQAKQLVTSLVLGKKVRLQFISRAPSGEMLGRLDTDDPAVGVKDVAIELVKAGLARARQGAASDLMRAETEAREARRGVWGAAQ